MNATRLMACGAAFAFITLVRVLDAVGVENALESCMVSAVVATVLTALASYL